MRIALFGDIHANLEALDTVLADGTLDSEALELLFPALPLSDGASFTINAFEAPRGRVQTTTIRVTAGHEVTVPAGTFSAFKLDVQAGEVALVVYVSEDAPRRTLKVEIVGQPVSFELAG